MRTWGRSWSWCSGPRSSTVTLISEQVCRADGLCSSSVSTFKNFQDLLFDSPLSLLGGIPLICLEEFGELFHSSISISLCRDMEIGWLASLRLAQNTLRDPIRATQNTKHPALKASYRLEMALSVTFAQTISLSQDTTERCKLWWLGKGRKWQQLLKKRKKTVISLKSK